MKSIRRTLTAAAAVIAFGALAVPSGAGAHAGHACVRAASDVPSDGFGCQVKRYRDHPETRAGESVATEIVTFWNGTDHGTRTKAVVGRWRNGVYFYRVCDHNRSDLATPRLKLLMRGHEGPITSGSCLEETSRDRPYRFQLLHKHPPPNGQVSHGSEWVDLAAPGGPVPE